jgi:hypothetical protein
MGQRLPKRIILRRAHGTADLSCDLSTGSGHHAGRFVSAPVPLPSLSLAIGRVIGSVSDGDTRLCHQSTLSRMPSAGQARGILF